MNKLFVYGTIREMNGERKEATHYLDGYAMYDAGPYPYIMPNSCYEVVGEVVEVDNDGLAAMDRYEGLEAGLYTRERLTVYPMEDGEEVECFVYVAGNRMPNIVENGDWFNRET